MKNYTQILDDWSKEVDENLPVNCPKKKGKENLINKSFYLKY
jgi:hypothetical protein